MPIPMLALYFAQPGGGIVAFLPMILIFVIFYFMLILPQQKRQKKTQEMLGALKNGDRVITSGGIRGTVVSLKDDSVQIRVAPDNLRLEVMRGAIVSVVNETTA